MPLPIVCKFLYKTTTVGSLIASNPIRPFPAKRVFSPIGFFPSTYLTISTVSLWDNACFFVKNKGGGLDFFISLGNVAFLFWEISYLFPSLSI